MLVRHAIVIMPEIIYGQKTDQLLVKKMHLE